MTLAALSISLLSAISTGAGQVFFKKAGVKKHPGFLHKFLDPQFLLGVLFFVVAAGATIWALTLMEFSSFYTLTALNYLFIILFSRWFLNEKIDRFKVIGTLIVISGIILYNIEFPGSVL